MSRASCRSRTRYKSRSRGETSGCEAARDEAGADGAGASASSAGSAAAAAAAAVSRAARGSSAGGGGGGGGAASSASCAGSCSPAVPPGAPSASGSGARAPSAAARSSRPAFCGGRQSEKSATASYPPPFSSAFLFLFVSASETNPALASSRRELSLLSSRREPDAPSFSFVVSGTTREPEKTISPVSSPRSSESASSSACDLADAAETGCESAKNDAFRASRPSPNAGVGTSPPMDPRDKGVGLQGTIGFFKATRRSSSESLSLPPEPTRSHLLTSWRTRSTPRCVRVCVAPSTTMRSSSSLDISHPVSFFMPITHAPCGPIRRPIWPHACTAHRFGPSHSG